MIVAAGLGLIFGSLKSGDPRLYLGAAVILLTIAATLPSKAEVS